jgi:hypothetical protein
MRGDEAPGQDEPIIKGYDTSACGVPEGVRRGLWREPKYLVFLSRLESLDAMQETAPPLAKALGVSETRAMELLMNVPKGKLQVSAGAASIENSRGIAVRAGVYSAITPF